MSAIANHIFHLNGVEMKFLRWLFCCCKIWDFITMQMSQKISLKTT